MNAYLLLANGMVFAGQSVGAAGVTVGEVVFATGMVGFEETLTDPSYYGQIITQTYPLIGNYGMNRWDMESGKVWARGYIVREACRTPSNWRSEETLDSFLKKNNIIGIEGIDTPPPDPGDPGERRDERRDPDRVRPRRPRQPGQDRGPAG